VNESQDLSSVGPLADKLLRCRDCPLSVKCGHEQPRYYNVSRNFILDQIALLPYNTDASAKLFERSIYENHYPG
jgi:hypothetical protein